MLTTISMTSNDSEISNTAYKSVFSNYFINTHVLINKKIVMKSLRPQVVLRSHGTLKLWC